MKHPFEMKSQSSSTNESTRVYGVLSVTYTVIGKLVKKNRYFRSLNHGGSKFLYNQQWKILGD
jgi:hypothetical protein